MPDALIERDHHGRADAAILLREDFSDNNPDGWTLTTQGTVSAPAVWSASSGALRQTSDVHSTPTTVTTVLKLGTLVRWTAGSSWTNYSATVELRGSDNDTLGVMFRHNSSSGTTTLLDGLGTCEPAHYQAAQRNLDDAVAVLDRLYAQPHVRAGDHRQRQRAPAMQYFRRGKAQRAS